MSVFDIPTERLLDLNDADLRELIARLCEAEREQQGGHRNDVRWGGSQTAADGGLDVVVAATTAFEPRGPLTRSKVGIQVKAGDLTKEAIFTEMFPNGVLRPAIADLAAQGGAYLIACAGVTCSETMLKRREAAMRSAITNSPHNELLHVAFLDRNAISRWVSAHPSVVAWLRQRLDLPILRAWQPHGVWSATPSGIDDTLICEEGLVFQIARDAPIKNMSEALSKIGNLVLEGKRAVRIAGLSGIGKSRIVQALFEGDSMEKPLPLSQAIYADLGQNPAPSPIEMLDTLIHRNAQAILVIDNCPPETHQALARRLAERCGPVRLITVEYDVRADRPEETDVVRIEAEGPDIVEALIRRRHDNLSSADARRLADLAHGNARLGLALAAAAPETGTLTAFEDTVLFDRLFWQRGQQDPELARAAEVLSLVYSFDVDGDEEPDELAFLGNLAGLPRQAMFRHASTLVGKGLAQARGRWRAVLPHALANRLSLQALQSLPWRTIADGVSDKPRLRRSLARRLSYLHDSREARQIVLRWMDVDGPLHGPEPDLDVLEAVCHLAPKEALHAIAGLIESIRQTPSGFHPLDSLTRMIMKIAHSEALFPLACENLIALSGTVDGQQASNTDSAIKDLFALYLSGTLARTEMRVTVARRYLASNDPTLAARGISMIGSALRTGHWSSSFLSYGDARPDTFGWEPRGAEVVDWFSMWFELLSETALTGPLSLRQSARKMFANKIDGLWRRVPSLRKRIDITARRLHAAEPWAEGCHAIRKGIYFIRRRGETFPDDDMEALLALMNHLAPTDLKSRIRAEIAKGWDFDLDDSEDIPIATLQRYQRLEAIGQELAADLDTLRMVGRELLTVESASFDALGTGLAKGTDNAMEVWEILRDLHLISPEETRQINVLCGFLYCFDEIDHDIASMIRGQCLTVPALRCLYPLFLPKGVLPAQELNNIIEIAAEADTRAWLLTDIAWREERQMDDVDRVRFLRVILDRADGASLVVNALSMLAHVEAEAAFRDHWPKDLRAVGRDAIVASFQIDDLNDNTSHYLSSTLRAILRNSSAGEVAEITEALTLRAAKKYGSLYDMRQTLATLAHSHPYDFLNWAFPEDETKSPFRFRDGFEPEPLSKISADALIKWCSESVDRWAIVAPHVPLFGSRDDANGEGAQLESLALDFLAAAPAPDIVLESYFQNLAPMSWSGSRADIMDRRLAVLKANVNSQLPEVCLVMQHRVPELSAYIERIRKKEHEEDQARNLSFE